jgi:hypothetical protein
LLSRARNDSNTLPAGTPMAIRIELMLIRLLVAGLRRRKEPR